MVLLHARFEMILGELTDEAGLGSGTPEPGFRGNRPQRQRRWFDLSQDRCQP